MSFPFILHDRWLLIASRLTHEVHTDSGAAVWNRYDTRNFLVFLCRNTGAW